MIGDTTVDTALQPQNEAEMVTEIIPSVMPGMTFRLLVCATALGAFLGSFRTMASGVEWAAVEPEYRIATVQPIAANLWMSPFCGACLLLVAILALAAWGVIQSTAKELEDGQALEWDPLELTGRRRREIEHGHMDLWAALKFVGKETSSKCSSSKCSSSNCSTEAEAASEHAESSSEETLTGDSESIVHAPRTPQLPTASPAVFQSKETHCLVSVPVNEGSSAPQSKQVETTSEVNVEEEEEEVEDEVEDEQEEEEEEDEKRNEPATAASVAPSAEDGTQLPPATKLARAAPERGRPIRWSDCPFDDAAESEEPPATQESSSSSASAPSSPSASARSQRPPGCWDTSSEQTMGAVQKMHSIAWSANHAVPMVACSPYGYHYAMVNPAAFGHPCPSQFFGAPVTMYGMPNSWCQANADGSATASSSRPAVTSPRQNHRRAASKDCSRGEDDLPAKRSSVKNGMSMQEIMETLADIEETRVVIARRIKQLGFKSGTYLRQHFQEQGPVDGVFVSHSHLQTRVRPASLAFAIMATEEGAKAVLAQGSEQVVRGVTITLSAFKRPSSRDARHTGSNSDGEK